MPTTHDDELALRSDKEALKWERHSFENIVKLNPYAMMILNREGRIVDANQAYISLFGEMPQPSYNLFEDPLLLEAGLSEELAALRQGELFRVPEIWYNPCWIRPEYPDKEICFEAAIFPTFDSEGEIHRFVGVLIDITRRRRIEQELQKAKEAAEAASRAKSEFLDIASHELRTPLTSLRLLLQMIRRTHEAQESISPQSISRMERQVDRLVNLVEDLLDVSRLERGALSFRPVSLDLRPLVAEVVEDIRRQFPQRAITLTLPDMATEVVADPVRIEQVMANLLDNATKYSPPTSPLEVSLRILPSAVRVKVTDHGPGIAPDQQHLLFSRFYRVSSDETLRQPGLGLGLYISKLIVAKHGGAIAVDTVVGAGSAFFFELPRLRPGLTQQP